MAMNLMLEEALKNVGINKKMEFDSAVDGVDGLHKMTAKALKDKCDVPYKLVFIDLNMPNMGGM